MQALILAAGRGSRLGNKSHAIPKCLLDVGRRPLIEHQLEALAEAGVGPVMMVLGYCADEVQEAVGIRAEYLINSRWQSTNSLYSFFLAREWVKGPVLVLNCDILFHPRMIDRLLSAKGDAIAFDSSSGLGREHMKVQVAGGRLVAMAKDLPEDIVSGENVGIIRLTEETAGAVFKKAEELLANGGEKNWLGAAICQVAAEREITAVDVAGLPWGEVDFPYDLDRARKEVWPAIRRTTGRRFRAMRFLAAAAVLALAVLTLAASIRSMYFPSVYAWENLEIRGAQKVRLAAGERSQDWWMLRKGGEARVAVQGPVTLRLESRLLLSETDLEIPYVLDVRLDGARLDWFKESAAPSHAWRQGDAVVSKHREVRLEIPPGRHTLDVRLIASEAASCFLRARRLDLEVDE